MLIFSELLILYMCVLYKNSEILFILLLKKFRVNLSQPIIFHSYLNLSIIRAFRVRSTSISYSPLNCFLFLFSFFHRAFCLSSLICTNVLRLLRLLAPLASSVQTVVIVLSYFSVACGHQKVHKFQLTPTPPTPPLHA